MIYFCWFFWVGLVAMASALHAGATVQRLARHLGLSNPEKLAIVLGCAKLLIFLFLSSAPLFSGDDGFLLGAGMIAGYTMALLSGSVAILALLNVAVAETHKDQHTPSVE